MATDKPRFSITLDTDMMENVMDYKEKNKLSTQSKAIQRLIEIGIREVTAERAVSSVSTGCSKVEAQLVEAWRQADDKTRRKVAIDLEDYGFTYTQDADNTNAG